MLNAYETMMLSEIESVCQSVNEKAKGKLCLSIKSKDSGYSLYNNDVEINFGLDIDTLNEIVSTFQTLVYMC